MTWNENAHRVPLASHALGRAREGPGILALQEGVPEGLLRRRGGVRRTASTREGSRRMGATTEGARRTVRPREGCPTDGPTVGRLPDESVHHGRVPDGRVPPRDGA